MAMPCMLFFFTFKFPAALCFYWFTTNIVSVGQVGRWRIFYRDDLIHIYP